VIERRLAIPINPRAGGDLSLMRSLVFGIAITFVKFPGSRYGFPPFVLAPFGFGVIGAIALLFRWRTFRAFVADGWPCAVMELMITVPATLVFWLLARRGALFASAALGAAVTGLAVFLALTPLQFQCMFQQAPHLLVWHGGTVAILVGMGAAIGGMIGSRHSILP
jgi:hypothetical protein